MNKNLIEPALFVIPLGLLLFSMGAYLGYISYKSITFDENNNCLITIAKDYCSDNGLYYDSIYWSSGAGFSCKVYQRRSYSLERFEFLDKEIKRCMK